MQIQQRMIKWKKIIFGHLYCMAIRLFYVGKYKGYNSFIRSSHLINEFVKTLSYWQKLFNNIIIPTLISIIIRFLSTPGTTNYTCNLKTNRSVMNELHNFFRQTTTSIIPPFHWTAFPLRFEFLVKMTRNAAETPRA